MSQRDGHNHAQRSRAPQSPAADGSIRAAYQLTVTLSCTGNSSKRERELSFAEASQTTADLQDAVQERFNVPSFDQKILFGPVVLSTAGDSGGRPSESLHSYGLRSGDFITVEYTSEADVRETLSVVRYLKRTLDHFETPSVGAGLHLSPIPADLDAQLRQTVDLQVLDSLSALHVSAPPGKKVMNSLLFVRSGGLRYLQRLHSLFLGYPLRAMTVHVQLLEIGLVKLLWMVSSCPETEGAMLKELNWDNVVRSLLRFTAVPYAAITPPRNPGMDVYGSDFQLQVLLELLTVTTGTLSCILEFSIPHVLRKLVTNQKFLEQITGALLSTSVPFRTYLTVMCVLVDLAYDVDAHTSLSKPHVIQAIIRTWKHADPTPENGATPSESIYLRYLVAVTLSLICSSKHDFSAMQYLEVEKVLESFIQKADYKELHAIEDEIGIHWNKYLPYMRVAYLPYDSKRVVLASHSNPIYKAIKDLCVEICILSFLVSLRGEPERKRLVQQGLLDYIICLPSVLPEKSRAHHMANALVASLGKEMQLQPPSLNTMARARLAVTHLEFERVMNAPVHEIVLLMEREM